jgi:integrase
LAKVDKGGDPSADRHARRHDLTIAYLVDLYLAEGPKARPQKKASSWAMDSSALHRHVVPLLGRRHLSTLTKSDIEDFQHAVTKGQTKADERTKSRGRAIVKGGPAAAARATAVLSAMLSWAADRRPSLLPSNPAKGVRLNKARKRERFLSTDELGRLGLRQRLAERQGVNSSALDIIRLLLFTGARRTEIASLRWNDVDFERGALRLADSKTGEKQIALGAPALEVLAGRKLGAPSYWVFPAARGAGHFVGIPKVWRKVATAAGLEVGKAAGTLGVRVHDLRHGFASVAVANGTSLYLVGKILGHTQAATTQRYAHLQLDPVRAVADRTARKIAGALERKGGAVVKLSRGHAGRSPQ